MRTLLLLTIIMIPIIGISQSIMPDDFELKFGEVPEGVNVQESDNGIFVSENQKIKSKLFSKFKYRADENGVYSITFQVRNMKKVLSIIEKEYPLIHELDDVMYNHKEAVYGDLDYEFYVDFDDYFLGKSVTIKSFKDRPFRFIVDKFYNETTMSSLRFGKYKKNSFDPYLDFDLKVTPEKALRGVIDLTLSDWLYSDEIIFSLNNGDKILKFALTSISNDVYRNKGLRFTEKTYFDFTKQDANKIYDAKNILVRISGEKYIEFPLTQSQKFAFYDIMNLELRN